MHAERVIEATVASWKSLGPLLSHPLLLLALGTLLSGLLIPRLTREWQDHQKALEIRTDLVGEMSEAVMTVLVDADVWGPSASGTADPEAASEHSLTAYREWKVRSAVIESRLRAYFPDDTLATEWYWYQHAVASFLQLHAATGENRADLLTRYIEPNLGGATPTVEWSVLQRPDDPRYLNQWSNLYLAIQARLNEFVTRVLHEPMSGF
jgi:hypothetical protein